MNLYEKTEAHAKNNDAFRKFCKRYEWAKFYQPNAEKAPWHWQCLVRGEGPYTTMINIWPHIAKAQVDGCKSVSGWDQIRLVMSLAIDANGFDEVGDLVE